MENGFFDEICNVVFRGSVSQKRFEAAEVAATDVNIAKLELEKSRAQQVLVDSHRDTSLAELNRLMGRNPKTLLTIRPAPFLFIATNDEMVAGQTLARRPDRQMAALAINKAAAEIKLARAEKWEDWTVGFDYRRDRSSFRAVPAETDQFLGLSVSIPLPLWNRKQGRISEAQATQQRAEAELEALDLAILTEVQIALARRQRIQPLLKRYADAVKLSEDNIALLQKGYADGLVPINSVIQAQQQLSELRQTLLETTGEYNQAIIALQTATATNPNLK